MVQSIYERWSIKTAQTSANVTQAPASERLLALYPGLGFDREVATRVVNDRCFPKAIEGLPSLRIEATLADFLNELFLYDSSREEFLWSYISEMTGEKVEDVYNQKY